MEKFEISGKIETMTWAFVEIGENTHKDSWRPEEICCLSDSCEELSSDGGVKISHYDNNNMDILSEKS